MFSCICCACFIWPASWFFIMVKVPSGWRVRRTSAQGLDGIGANFRIEPAERVLDERLVAERGLGLRLRLGLLALPLRGERRLGLRPDLECEHPFAPGRGIE